jgi:hypothetical protein
MSGKANREHLDWLLEETAETARTYLDLLERAKALPEDSDERGDLEGDLHAYLLQLELDAKDTRDAMDAYSDSLSEDEEVPA